MVASVNRLQGAEVVDFDVVRRQRISHCAATCNGLRATTIRLTEGKAMLRRSQVILAIVAVLSSISASSAVAGFVSFSVPSVAVQDVQLFPGSPVEINATLAAKGTVDWNLNIDANGNTINS